MTPNVNWFSYIPNQVKVVFLKALQLKSWSIRFMYTLRLLRKWLWKKWKFLDILKHTDITPVFKRGSTTNKSNNRPVSILSNFSKVLEKLIYTQLNSFTEPKLSNCPTGFCKNQNILHTLLKRIKLWRSMLNRSNKVGAIVMKLSKAFDTLNYITSFYGNLKVYDFDTNALSFIRSYILNRHQRTKVTGKFLFFFVFF